MQNIYMSKRGCLAASRFHGLSQSRECKINCVNGLISEDFVDTFTAA